MGGSNSSFPGPDCFLFFLVPRLPHFTMNRIQQVDLDEMMSPEALERYESGVGHGSFMSLLCVRQPYALTRHTHSTDRPDLCVCVCVDGVVSRVCFPGFLSTHSSISPTFVFVWFGIVLLVWGVDLFVGWLVFFLMACL